MLPPSLPRVDVELYPVNNVPRRVGKPQAPFDIDCEASPSTFRIAEVTIKLISPGWRIETEDTIQQEAINRKMTARTGRVPIRHQPPSRIRRTLSHPTLGRANSGVAQVESIAFNPENTKTSHGW
ncbi:hypothetical protein COH20_010117 [Aspergillus flavus]|nr:hypothetical protein COH20_010117 [Aspergillus flavus]